MSNLIFPSGLSIQRAKKRAKELVKLKQFDCLFKALDSIALKESGKPWALAIEQLKPSHLISTTQNNLITIADIERVMKSEPLLTYFGFEHVDTLHDSFYMRRRLGTREEYKQRFKENKEKLRNAVVECQNCCIYLHHLKKLNVVRYRYGSYGLKHSVEKYNRQRGLSYSDGYISNGVFICAAIHMGFKVIRMAPDNPNAWVCISARSDIILWERLSFEEPILSSRDKRLLEKIKQRIGLS